MVVVMWEMVELVVRCSRGRNILRLHGRTERVGDVGEVGRRVGVPHDPVRPQDLPSRGESDPPRGFFSSRGHVDCYDVNVGVESWLTGNVLLAYDLKQGWNGGRGSSGGRGEVWWGGRRLWVVSRLVWWVGGEVGVGVQVS